MRPEIKMGFTDFNGNGGCLVKEDDGSLDIGLQNCSYRIRKTDHMKLEYRAGIEGQRTGVLKVGGFSIWTDEPQLQKLALAIEKHLE